jgi:hypothetical protein
MKRRFLMVVFIALGMLWSNGRTFAESEGSGSTKKGTCTANPAAPTPDLAGGSACTCRSRETAVSSFRMNLRDAGSSKFFRNSH